MLTRKYVKKLETRKIQVHEAKNGQKKGSGMYPESAKQWSVHVGCRNGCIYCIESFQKQYKRQKPTIDKNGRKRGCWDCYNFRPHPHPERLNEPLPRTPKDKFIFTASGGDISFASRSYIREILDRIRYYADRKFLIQTKNPEKLFRKVESFPENVCLNITLETNRDKGYGKISKAEAPSKRVEAYIDFEHAHKFLTIEPVFDFDEGVLLNRIKQVNPKRVYIGYESKGVSKKCKLPEPSLAKTQRLIKKLQKFTTVYTKLLRNAWWEK